MNSPKKILYFCSSSVYGGAERFVETCLHEHRENGENIHVFFLNLGPFSHILEEDGFDIYYPPFKTKLSHFHSWLRFQVYFYKFLRKKNITHVHFTMAYSQLFGALAASLAGVKIVWFQHGPIGGIIDRFANLLPYDVILFNSQFTKSSHLTNAGKIKSPHKIIDLSVNVKFDSKSVAKIKASYPQGYLISMGRICRWKGYEEIINMFSNITAKYDLLIIGKASSADDKEYEEELKLLCEKLKVDSRVHFLGFKRNVHDYVKGSLALLHNSTIPEPFGLVVSEAKSLGVFVYAKKLGGVIDQIKSNEDGYLYDNLEQLTQVVQSELHYDKANSKNYSANNSGNSDSLAIGHMMQQLNNCYN